MRVDLEEVQEERRTLQLLVDNFKTASDDAKQRLKEEKKRPENTKAFGQPVRAAIDDVLKKHGIDRAAHF